MSFLLSSSAGVMTSVSLIELMPESIEAGGKLVAAMGFLMGTVGLYILDRFLPHVHRTNHNEETGAMRRAGILIGLGIMLHNLPEGLAIGAAYAHEQSFGLSIAILIMLQNIPEGIAMSAPLIAGCVPRTSVVMAAVVAGVPMGIGALLGSVFGNLSPTGLSLALGSAAGAMMYVTGHELIPGAHRFAEPPYPTNGLLVGICIGIVASILS
jgi:ZIP family zinc transporter